MEISEIIELIINWIKEVLKSMGLFNGFLETKYCSICGNALSLFENKKLKDGNCCKNCSSLLSPYFKERKQSTVDEIKYQIECRKENKIKLDNFHITRSIGNKTKVLIDEGKGQFMVAPSPNYKKEKIDVINCSDIIDCTIDINESREEIKYIDSNENIKSFNPPSYAYSYDFFVEISVNVPYIKSIRFKVNDSPINNSQETLIKINEGGLINKFVDAFISTKNYGIKSNSNEVKSSAQYQKCNQIANDICNTLLRESFRPINNISSASTKIKCPWCGSKITNINQETCNHCGGPLGI